MSPVGTRRPTVALQNVGSYVGYTGCSAGAAGRRQVTRCGLRALLSFFSNGKRFGKGSTNGLAAGYRHACRSASSTPSSGAIVARTQLSHSSCLFRVPEIMEGSGEYEHRLPALRLLPS